MGHFSLLSFHLSFLGTWLWMTINDNLSWHADSQILKLYVKSSLVYTFCSPYWSFLNFKYCKKYFYYSYNFEIFKVRKVGTTFKLFNEVRYCHIRLLWQKSYFMFSYGFWKPTFKTNKNYLALSWTRKSRWCLSWAWPGSHQYSKPSKMAQDSGECCREPLHFAGGTLRPAAWWALESLAAGAVLPGDFPGMVPLPFWECCCPVRIHNWSTFI